MIVASLLLFPVQLSCKVQSSQKSRLATDDVKVNSAWEEV